MVRPAQSLGTGPGGPIIVGKEEEDKKKKDGELNI
jgi:hypothetical protein